MIRHKAIAGVLLLCAAIVPYAAQSASANQGTTAFTCKESKGTGTFADAHCKEGKAGGNFEHAAIAENTTTEVIGTNEGTGGETAASTEAILKFLVNGVVVQLKATGVAGSGSMTNVKEAGEHYVHGLGTLTFSGITLAGGLPGLGCKVFTDSGFKGEEGVIHTNTLTATTKAQGDFLKLTPAEGSSLATFTIEGCEGPAAIKALNKTYTLEGSVKCPTSGATVICGHTETTSAETLKLNGTIKAGLSSSLTIKGRANSKESYAALSTTTVNPEEELEETEEEKETEEEAEETAEIEETEETEETKESTAFTCKESKGTGSFADAHCKEAKVGGDFEHTAIAEGTTTEVTGTSEGTGTETVGSTPAALKFLINGIQVELKATAVFGEGSLTNLKSEAGEHYVDGFGTLTFTGTSVKPSGKGCKVFTDSGFKGEEGVVHTNLLTATTKAQGDSVKLSPNEGSSLATFTIEGCEGEALKVLNKTYTLEGSLKCPTSGATVVCSHTETTAAETLKLNGTIKAGLSSSLTIKGRANSKESYAPLSTTTVET